jgi:hypothetical protein
MLTCPNRDSTTRFPIQVELKEIPEIAWAFAQVFEGILKRCTGLGVKLLMGKFRVN